MIKLYRDGRVSKSDASKYFNMLVDQEKITAESGRAYKANLEDVRSGPKGKRYSITGVIEDQCDGWCDLRVETSNHPKIAPKELLPFRMQYEFESHELG
jgi:hypothetical protein